MTTELLPVDPTETDEVELVKCDVCETLLTQDEYDARDGWCEVCYAKPHRICEACHVRNHIDDMGTEFPMCCQTCESVKHTEIADDLWGNQITDLVGSWSGEEYEIPRLRKLLAYAKGIK